jgi:hypothetical protein
MVDFLVVSGLRERSCVLEDPSAARRHLRNRGIDDGISLSFQYAGVCATAHIFDFLLRVSRVVDAIEARMKIPFSLRRLKGVPFKSNAAMCSIAPTSLEGLAQSKA